MGWRLADPQSEAPQAAFAGPGFWRHYRAALVSALCRQGLLTAGQAERLQEDGYRGPQGPCGQQEKGKMPHAG